MKLTVVVVLAAIALTACAVPPSDMQRLMRQEGITQFQDLGYVYYGCGEGDAYHSGFTGVKNGVPVTGFVCGGGLAGKGYTVRYK